MYILDTHAWIWYIKFKIKLLPLTPDILIHTSKLL